MTQLVLKPNGSTASGTVTIQGGLATIHESLADTQQSTYVAIQVPGSYVILDFTTGAIPAGSVMLPTLMRNWADFAGGYANMQAVMYRVGSNSKTPFTFPISNWTNVQNTATDNGVSNVTTQADVDGYQMYIGIPSSLAAPAAFYVNNVNVVIKYAKVPTISVTAPYGTITTGGTQTVRWTFTKDPDGAGQSKYQVKLFNQTQWQAGGFNPDTSPAYYDSGIVAGAAVSHVVPHIFPELYFGYVRACSTNMGVDQWSAWGNTPFQITGMKYIRTWDGAAFSAKPVKVWNGTTFVESPGVKIWNGSAWVSSVSG